MELEALTTSISIQVIKRNQKGDTKDHMLRGQQAHSIMFPAISIPNLGSYVVQGSIQHQISSQKLMM